MASLDFAKTRRILAKEVVGQVGDDQGVVIRLKYVGKGSVTSVTVTTATNIVTVSVELGVTVTKTYAFASYATVGALVDAINADGLFEGRVLDGLRSFATASSFVDGAISLSNGYFDVLNDTSASLKQAYRLAVFDREVGVNYKLYNQHRVTLKEIVTNVTLGGGADANALKIYECGKGGVEKLIYQTTPTSGSVATINWASGQGGITAADGNDIVVVVSDGTSVTGTITVSGINE